MEGKLMVMEVSDEKFNELIGGQSGGHT